MEDAESSVKPPGERLDRKLRVLCICQGGNCRSVAAAYVLKYGHGIDALACGWEGNTPETLAHLCSWADQIVVMQEAFREKVPKRFHKKLQVCDVGPDRWFNGLHPELVDLIKAMVSVA